MPRSQYTGISIKNQLAEEIENFLKTRPNLGYRSITHFVETAILEELTQLRKQYPDPPRFEQIHTNDHGTKILDRHLKEVIQIHIEPSGITCGCKEYVDCEHITYALKLPEVQKVIEKRKKEGWKLPDP